MRGIYLTTHSFSERKIREVRHYTQYADINAAVMHVKDPHGFLYWQSQHPVALAMGAVKGRGRLEKAVSALKSHGVWTIAKLDLFQDTLLAQQHPDMAVLDTETDAPWRNKNELCWTNPYNLRVWEYNIALAKELVALGFDEIQFDYIRFPSDGDLKRIKYRKGLGAQSKVKTIGTFLKTAKEALHPLGATISVDLFGLVAWKKDDFGVGQRIEEIAPHVDAICPMLYPSHFPKGFLGKDNPGAFPKEIMSKSVQRLLARTSTPIRPWIQGFWYTPEEIVAQIEGVMQAGVKEWLVWNPASNYERMYAACALRSEHPLPPVSLYSALDQLVQGPVRIVRGLAHKVHYTDYEAGYTIVRLEAPLNGKVSPYGTPGALLNTVDEAVMDRILAKRAIEISPTASPTTKVPLLVQLLCSDLDVSARGMSTQPIYIDWQTGCRFTSQVPAACLASMQAAATASRQAAVPH